MEECKRRKELGLPEVYLYEKETKAVSYTDFVNKELVLFSNCDNERSIPCMVDGLKPGQRKVWTSSWWVVLLQSYGSLIRPQSVSRLAVMAVGIIHRYRNSCSK